MPKADIYYIEVLGKALDVLDVFAKAPKPALTLHSISQLSKLNKNTVFRVLHTLARHGYVVKRGRDYELGPSVADLASAKLRPRDLLAAAGPVLDSLRDRFGETVNLGVLDGSRIRYVDVRESPHRIRLAERVGGSDYLHCTALGKATLAYLPFEEVRARIKEQGLPKLTARTITTLSALKAELAKVRKQGYAVDNEESMPGAFCVAAAVLDNEGAPVAAVSMSGPTTRFNAAHVPAASAAVREAAAAIASAMGYSTGAH